ncbi:hypothetical protein M8J77_010430 [Diaphorina citri]|nr:hypothetical protein M8J77_010430 [Diaphorina citri]
MTSSLSPPIRISGHSWTNSKMIDTSTPSFEPSSDFDNLKLSIMPLNLNSEKSKISLGRSGSMTKRRPPTRPRSLLCSTDDASDIINTIIPAPPPDKAAKEPRAPARPAPKLKISELASNADRTSRYATPTVKSIKSEITKSSERYARVADKTPSPAPYKSPTIVRNESLKSPKIFRSLIGNRKAVEADSSDNEHKPLEAKKSVSSEDISQDYDAEVDHSLKRSSAARRSLNLHRDNHWSSQHTNELENVFKKVLKNKTFYSRPDLEEDELKPVAPSKKSFVSVETIQNIRSNLKPVEDSTLKVSEVEESARNGVETSSKHSDATHTPVKNYNTGSLENKQTRNEEWYNRRKSYGFEQMKDDSQHTTGNSVKNIESSTDSGIAKSNENIDTLVKKGIVNPNNDLFEVRRNSLSKNSKIYNTLMSLRDSNKKTEFENGLGVVNHDSVTEQYGDRIHALREPNTVFNGTSKVKDTQNEPLFITIKPKEEHTSVINIPNKNEMKVESTMVEDGEYFRKVKEIYDKGAWMEDKNGDSKKPKKVEFSKTEVHFEPGKVNIIETNEKPPPTNNYRRRKKDRAERNAERAERNHTDKVERPSEKPNFPETKFGDEMKKPIIALPYEPKVHEAKVYEPMLHDEPTETNIEIVVDETEDDPRKPKSILKSAKLEETANENIDQTKPDFQKILNSFKTSERQNSNGSPPIVDNGLKVRISSGNNQFDQRRASWCVPENGNKYSTKINFGADNITVLPQKTRYSYCEPSPRTIQSICSQPITNENDPYSGVKNDNFDPYNGITNPVIVNAPTSDDYSRFRTKSPLSNVTKTIIINPKDHVSSVSSISNDFLKGTSISNGFLKGTDSPESVPRRHPDRSSELSNAILNRYSYTESTKSPILSEPSPHPARYSYCEPSEPIWYQHERQDLLNTNRQEKLIVRIGSKNVSNDKCRTNEPLFLKHVINQENLNKTAPIANDSLKSESQSVAKHNPNLKSTKLVLQANGRTVFDFPSTSSNNSSNTLRTCFKVLGNEENRYPESFGKNRTEINSSTFLENVVAEPLESITNKSAPNDMSSPNTNNLRCSSNVMKSNSFPCSSKMLNSNFTFPSYRKSYLIAIGAENEIHKDFNIKTYPRRKERNDMNVKLLELNKELPPRSPSKQFLSISFDNIHDGKLLKNNDLTEPSPLIVPLNRRKLSQDNEQARSSHSINKMIENICARESRGILRSDSKRIDHIKLPLQAPFQTNGFACHSDTSTESSLNFDERYSENTTSTPKKSFVKLGSLSERQQNMEQQNRHIINNHCDNKIETVQNDLIPSVLSDLENLSKSIDEEIFDIPNKVKRRPSILDDDIYCLESTEKVLNEPRRHRTCYKCNYDKNNANFENESKYKRHSFNGKSRVNLKVKSDEEYRKTNIKQTPQVSDMEGLKSKINCKKKSEIKKIKSIEDLQINKLINAINKNCQNGDRSQNSKNSTRGSHFNNDSSTDSVRCATDFTNRLTGNVLVNQDISSQTMSKSLNDKYLNSLNADALELEVVNEKLSNELERLTNEFKKNISSDRTPKPSTSKVKMLTKVFSENEIYNLMNSEKSDDFGESRYNLQSRSTNSSQIRDTGVAPIADTSGQTRCDNFKHDFNNSKFKLINAKSSKLICDTSAHTNDTRRNSLLRNHKSSPLLNGDEAELSDDSLKADEEVRNLLMHSEERNNTEVQQWKGGASSHSITTNQSITTTSNKTNIQISSATTNHIQAKDQFSLNSAVMNTPKTVTKKEPSSEPVQITSIALHYEAKPSKPKTFQPVCLVYKPESPTNKTNTDHENAKPVLESSNTNVKSHQRTSKETVQEKNREEKSISESHNREQRIQAHKISNELKKINECIKLTSHRSAEKVTKRPDKITKEEAPKRPARKVKEEPIYEKIHHRSKKDSEVNKNDSLRLKNHKEHVSLRSSGRDGWLNIPKDNGHIYMNSKDSKLRSRDSSVESNHTLTNRSRTSSMSSNIRSRTSSMESNSQLHSAVLLKSRNSSLESVQRSRTSSIDSNRSNNLRNTGRINSNNSTPVRSRTSSIESDRSYQGMCKPKSDPHKSRLSSTSQIRRYVTSKTRESNTRVSPIVENKRSTKQLLESANKGISIDEMSTKSKQYLARNGPSRSRNSSADSTILIEELTKAADEILLAVNGYTDEDSIRGSDDERKKKKSYKPLSTIAETPNRLMSSSKKSSRKSEAPIVVRENVYSNVRNQRRSSNSSLEIGEKSNTRTPKAKVQENIYANIKPAKASSNGEKVAKKKTTRMQRTSSREILGSSSDEQTTQDEIKNKKLARRSKVKTTTTNMEVCQNKKFDRSAPPSKPRSSSVIRSVANHIIEHVTPASAPADKNSTEKKTLKTALFSKHSTNGTRTSKHQDSKSSSQTAKAFSMKTSSSVRKK